MKKSKRLEPVKKIAVEKETEAAIAVKNAQQEKNSCVEQLEKLKSYRQDYVAQYKAKGKTGISAARLNEYQLFVQKIDKAIKEQVQTVEKATAKTNSSQQHLQKSNQRKKVVENLINKKVKQERASADRSEQNTADDRPRSGGSLNDVLMWRLH